MLLALIFYVQIKDREEKRYRAYKDKVNVLFLPKQADKLAQKRVGEEVIFRPCRKSFDLEFELFGYRITAEDVVVSGRKGDVDFVDIAAVLLDYLL